MYPTKRVSFTLIHPICIIPSIDPSIPYKCPKFKIPTNSLNSDLYKSVKSGDVLAVKDLLSAHRGEIDLNEADSDGFQMLHRACGQGDMEMMSMLMEAGADPNAVDSCGDTPMHWACFRGNLEAVDLLLKGGANAMQWSSDGTTPLDAALDEGHSHILQRLFEQNGIFDLRAVLERVLLQGPLKIKGSRRRYQATRFRNAPRILKGYRTWKTQHVVVSEMLRSVFIWFNAEQTETEDGSDTVHFRFQDILSVRVVEHTKKKYTGRRFNVYFDVQHPSKMNFQVGSSGIDHLDDHDQFYDDADADFYKRARGRSRSGSKLGLDKGKRGLFHKKAPPPPPPKKSTSSNLVQHLENTPKYLCVSFLADSSSEMVRWVANLKVAGLKGKAMAAVIIQTAWRGFAAREKLQRMKQHLQKGSDVARRRGTRGVLEDPFYVPLDARYTQVPDKKLWSKPPGYDANKDELVLANRHKWDKRLYQSRTSPGNLLLRATGRKLKKPKKVKKQKGDPNFYRGFKGSGGFPKPTAFRRRTKELSVPITSYHNQEDISGMLLKKSSHGISRILGQWKMRFAVLSYSNAALQYYDPKHPIIAPLEEDEIFTGEEKTSQIRTIPFRQMLSITAWAETPPPEDALEHSDSDRLDSDDEHPQYVVPSHLRRFRIHLIGAKVYNFEAVNNAERDRWIQALRRVLPKENVASLTLQRVLRGLVARKKVARLKKTIRDVKKKRRRETALKIEEARRRSEQESLARAAQEELDAMKAQEDVARAFNLKKQELDKQQKLAEMQAKLDALDAEQRRLEAEQDEDPEDWKEVGCI